MFQLLNGVGITRKFASMPRYHHWGSVAESLGPEFGIQIPTFASGDILDLGLVTPSIITSLTPCSMNTANVSRKGLDYIAAS